MEYKTTMRLIVQTSPADHSYWRYRIIDADTTIVVRTDNGARFAGQHVALDCGQKAIEELYKNRPIQTGWETHDPEAT